MKINSRNVRIETLTMKLLWIPVFLSLIFITSAPTFADPYFVYGQVFQLSQVDADDEAIDDADLLGDARAYVTVKAFDSDSNTFLGQAIADQDGIFTVQYDKPAGSISNIHFRVYQEVTDPGTDEELLPARENINKFESVRQFFGAGLRVISDELVSYGADGLTTYPGVGIVFTRVGKVEIPFIEQDITEPLVGLADFSSDTPDPMSGLYRYQELHVKPFKHAPFARGLLIFGEFGLPGGACTGDEINYYRVKMRKYNETTSSWETPQYWSQSMRKMQTLVTTVPTISVNSSLVPVGPFDGTDFSTSATVEELYWVNRNVLGGATNTFYSFPDLRINWRTRNLSDGIYEISMEYYKYISGSADAPVVEKLNDAPGGCFAGPVPPTGAEGLHRLIVRINNQPINVKLDHIYLKDNSSGGGYLPKSGSSDVSDPADALDFNAEGLCAIMELENKYDVEVHFTAHHPGNYMRYYNLRAKPNACPRVTFVSEVYPEANIASPVFPSGATPPDWQGTALTGTVATAPKASFGKCGYIFTLSGSSRLQNGYNYVQWRHPQRAYYVSRHASAASCP